MSTDPSHAHFNINRYLHSELLPGNRPFWSCFAETTIRISHADNPKQQTPTLPVRFDSGSFCSLLPARWMYLLTAMGLGVSQNPVTFQTAAGSGDAFLLQGDAVTTFPNDPAKRPYRFDWFVTQSLDSRGYGLIALRDIVSHFVIRAEGHFELNAQGVPAVLPDLYLISNLIWDRVCYRCPHCGALTWGRAGLNLLCGDHNVVMPQIS